MTDQAFKMLSILCAFGAAIFMLCIAFPESVYWIEVQVWRALRAWKTRSKK
jgi:hypothetical protein